MPYAASMDARPQSSDQLYQAHALHPDQSPTADGTLDLCIDLVADAVSVARERHQVQREELDFLLKLQHYLFDKGNTKDQRLLQPKGTELWNVHRHKTSQIATTPIYLECRPQNPDADDPQLAEDARLILESWLFSTRYQSIRRRWVSGALAARNWIMAFDVVDGVGLYGRDVVPRLVAPWDFVWPDRWQDIHDPTCPWVAERTRMRLNDIRGMEGWKNTDKVYGDNADGPSLTGTRGGPPLGQSTTVRLDPGGRAQPSSEQEEVDVWKVWFRRDGTAHAPSHTLALPPGEQHAVCPECGYETTPEQAAQLPRDLNGNIDGGQLMPLCPDCLNAQPLRLTQLEAKTEIQDIDPLRNAPPGRLVIFVPHCRVVLYDGPWPYKMRSFPYMNLKAYDYHPIDQVGQSDASAHWSSQLILNFIKRFGWEQMRRNVDILIAPQNGLLNARGAPYQYGDVHGSIAYVKNAVDAQSLRHFQGAGIPAALPQLYQLFAQPMQGTLGTTDLGLTSAQSKDIPVGTVRQLVEQGEIPVRDHIDVVQQEESQGFGVVLDLLIQVWGADGRAVRYLGPDGQFRVKNLQAHVLLNSMDVLVTASPTLSVIKADEMDTFTKWAALPQAARRTVAKLSNVPISFVVQYEKDLQAEMDAAAAAAGATTTPPGGAGPPKPRGVPQPAVRMGAGSVSPMPVSGAA